MIIHCTEDKKTGPFQPGGQAAAPGKKVEREERGRLTEATWGYTRSHAPIVYHPNRRYCYFLPVIIPPSQGNASGCPGDGTTVRERLSPAHLVAPEEIESEPQSSWV